MSDPFGAKATKKAAKAQESATALQQQQQNLQAAKNRTEVIRSARTARAQAQNAASVQGVTTSSAAQGGQGAIQSQLTSNLSFLDNQNLITDQTSIQVGVQRKYTLKAQKAKSRLKFGASILGVAAGNI